MELLQDDEVLHNDGIYSEDDLIICQLQYDPVNVPRREGLEHQPLSSATSDACDHLAFEIYKVKVRN